MSSVGFNISNSSRHVCCHENCRHDHGKHFHSRRRVEETVISFDETKVTAQGPTPHAQFTEKENLPQSNAQTTTQTHDTIMGSHCVRAKRFSGNQQKIDFHNSDSEEEEAPKVKHAENNAVQDTFTKHTTTITLNHIISNHLKFQCLNPF